jgi:hypothetical protein
VSLRRFGVSRIVSVLPGGSSRPLLVESSAGRFVLKLVGGPEGPQALAAEWIGTKVAALAGLPTLEIAALELDPALATDLLDTELREFAARGAGLCLGVRQLAGARQATSKELTQADDDFALRILWLDVLVQNPDRRGENSNILRHGQALVAIDHASALPFHHDWLVTEDSPGSDLAAPPGHVFGSRAALLPEWHRRLRPLLSREALLEICHDLPDEWLGPASFATPSRQREAYAAYLWKRLRSMDALWPG